MWKIKKKPGKEKKTVATSQQKVAVDGKKHGSIWNPKNLQTEVHAFGYDFYWKTYLLTMLCVLLLIVAVGVFFRLEALYIGIIIAVLFIMLPVLIRDTYKRMFEQRRFSDAADYMEQLLYSFKKECKVLAALKECEAAMPEGMMKHTIGEAVAYIEKGQAKTNDGLVLEALYLIEEQYACEKMHAVHELLAGAEERGGDVEESIGLMIENIEIWKRQVYSLQNSKKICHMDCILSIVVAALLCGADMYIMNMIKDMCYAGEDISVFQMGAVQISSFLFLLICMFAFYRSNRKLAGDWLQRERKADKSLLKSYQYVIGYDEKKESKRSRLMALPFLIAVIPCYIWLSKWGSVVCMIVAAFLLVQHRFSYNMCRKDVRAALYMAFPEWMMDMALLLQRNNVQVAITKSIPKAEKILEIELVELSARIREDPEDVQSYTAFCSEFDVPEIASCMKMLYSVSEAGSGDAKRQIENLVGHVHKFEEREAEKKNERVGMQTRMICFYPIGATTAKMLVDMTAGMLLVLSLFQYAVR